MDAAHSAAKLAAADTHTLIEGLAFRLEKLRVSLNTFSGESPIQSPSILFCCLFCKKLRLPQA